MPHSTRGGSLSSTKIKPQQLLPVTVSRTVTSMVLPTQLESTFGLVGITTPLYFKMTSNTPPGQCVPPELSTMSGVTSAMQFSSKDN